MRHLKEKIRKLNIKLIDNLNIVRKHAAVSSKKAFNPEIFKKRFFSELCISFEALPSEIRIIGSYKTETRLLPH